MKIRESIIIFISALFILTACGMDDVMDRMNDLSVSRPETESRLVFEKIEELPEEAPAEDDVDEAAAEITPAVQYDDSVVENYLLEEADTPAPAPKESVMGGVDADDCIAYSTQMLEEIKGQQEGKYYYGQLSENEKTIYAQILRSMQKFDSDVEVSTLDAKVIERVFQCVMNDHPEIFYVQGFTYVKYTLGSELKKISFSGTYTMDETEKENRMTPIRQYTARAAACVTDDMDDYTKIKTIYQYIVENTEYDSHSIDNQNICSVMIGGRSVCQGYAKAMQYLLNEVGVDAALVLGTVSGGQGHAWNLVKSDGEYYYVDVTWGDASYRAVGGDTSKTQYRPSINYDYLCVTTDQICRTHQLSSPVKLPICVAVKDNYYRREGAWFTALDTEQLGQLFDRGYESEMPYITLKCAGREVYDAMYDYLITQQNIFKYLSGAGGTVNYTNDDNQWSMSFWL